jgi:hypothetical protein
MKSATQLVGKKIGGNKKTKSVFAKAIEKTARASRCKFKMLLPYFVPNVAALHGV